MLTPGCQSLLAKSFSNRARRFRPLALLAVAAGVGLAAAAFAPARADAVPRASGRLGQDGPSAKPGIFA